MNTKIGFIGLGAMGLPMAENLACGPGFEVRALNRSDRPFASLAAHPAWGRTLFRAASLADLADCGTVITMLPDSPTTNVVVLGGAGRPGLADILAQGATIVDMGSSDPVETLGLIEKLAPFGIRLIDAPVSGGVARARTGELTIMVGTDRAGLEPLRPLLATMGKTFFATGKPGAAHAIKALNNYLFAAGLLAATEALAIAEAMDLDLETFVDILNASTGRNVATATKLKEAILPGTFEGSFTLGLQAKDLATADSLRAFTGQKAQQLRLCREIWAAAVEALDGNADNTEIFRYVRGSATPGPPSGRGHEGFGDEELRHDQEDVREERAEHDRGERDADDRNHGTERLRRR